MLKVIGIIACIVASQQCFGEGLRVSTRPGLEFGAQISEYTYEEPNAPSMNLTGEKIGATGSYTVLPFEGDSFVTMDGRIAYGRLLYQGSGMLTRDPLRIENNPDLNIELRIVAGRDFLSTGEDFSISPYVGAGYRCLFSRVGFERQSQYWYVPLGLRARIKTGDRSVFVPTVEYDRFLGGRQKSKLGSTGFWSQDIVNKQRHGHGYRVSFMLESGDWSFGPWLHSWKIENSELVFLDNSFIWEPKNTTKEGGIELRYRF